jgi:hypothetical protein
MLSDSLKEDIVTLGVAVDLLNVRIDQIRDEGVKKGRMYDILASSIVQAVGTDADGTRLGDIDLRLTQLRLEERHLTMLLNAE